MALRFSQNPFYTGYEDSGQAMEESAETAGSALGEAIKYAGKMGGFGKQGRAYRKYLKGTFEPDQPPLSFQEWKKRNDLNISPKRARTQAEFKSLQELHPDEYIDWKTAGREWKAGDADVDEWGEQFFGTVFPKLYDLGIYDKTETPGPGTFENYLKNLKNPKDTSEKRNSPLQNYLNLPNNLYGKDMV